MISPLVVPFGGGLGVGCLRTSAHALFVARDYWGPQRATRCGSFRLPAPCRTSQVPRSLFRYAPSPVTPDGPVGACAPCFPTGGGLRHLREIGHQQSCVTEPNRVRLRWAHTFAVQGCTPFAPRWDRAAPDVRLPVRQSPRLRVDGATVTSDTFQSDRATRLGLAHRRTRRTHEEEEKNRAP